MGNGQMFYLHNKQEKVRYLLQLKEIQEDGWDGMGWDGIGLGGHQYLYPLTWSDSDAPAALLAPPP